MARLQNLNRWVFDHKTFAATNRIGFQLQNLCYHKMDVGGAFLYPPMRIKYWDAC